MSEAAPRPRYVIDVRISRFTIQAFAGGMLSALGHSPKFAARDFDGQVVFDPEAPEEAGLSFHLRAASLTLMDDVSERDRETILRTMHDDVLETERFPNIAYECPRAVPSAVAPGQLSVTLEGELTLHGVTRVQPITAKLNATGTTLRAFGEFTVRQSDYDIKQVTVAGSMLKVKDELKCTFDIVARR